MTEAAFFLFYGCLDGGSRGLRFRNPTPRSTPTDGEKAEVKLSTFDFGISNIGFHYYFGGK